MKKYLIILSIIIFIFFCCSRKGSKNPAAPAIWTVSGTPTGTETYSGTKTATPTFTNTVDLTDNIGQYQQVIFIPCY